MNPRDKRFFTPLAEMKAEMKLRARFVALATTTADGRPTLEQLWMNGMVK